MLKIAQADLNDIIFSSKKVEDSLESLEKFYLDWNVKCQQWLDKDINLDDFTREAKLVFIHNIIEFKQYKNQLRACQLFFVQISYQVCLKMLKETVHETRKKILALYDTIFDENPVSSSFRSFTTLYNIIYNEFRGEVSRYDELYKMMSTANTILVGGEFCMKEDFQLAIGSQLKTGIDDIFRQGINNRFG